MAMGYIIYFLSKRWYKFSFIVQGDTFETFIGEIFIGTTQNVLTQLQPKYIYKT